MDLKMDEIIIGTDLLSEQTDLERKENIIVERIRERFPDLHVCRQYTFIPNSGIGIRIRSKENMIQKINILLQHFNLRLNSKIVRANDFIYYEIIHKRN